jgi:glycosyltransferase involved in cell wall biosynthesis
MGWEIVDEPGAADLVATHAGVAADADATIPVVSHCHGLYWYGFEWPKWALKMNRDVIKAMRAADVVTAPSKWVAQAIARGTNINAQVLYHGIDPTAWEPVANKGYVLWNKTRVDPICDPTPLWELSKLAPNRKFISTVHWGMPPADNVEAVGVSSLGEHKAYIQNAGVYLCTTRETFGIGTLEAMAAGVPILGWAWGGQNEIVIHKETGWLAPANDYASLVEGLEYCFKHRRRLGAAARAHVLRNFTWEVAIRRYHDLYRSLLEPHTGPKISVVMPVHNMEAYIADSVKSVLDQPQADWELVVVDDASTDRSIQIVREVAGDNPRVRIITNPGNLYLAETLNAGISAARGKYIVPLDSDNMLGSNVLHVLSNALDRDRSIHIAYGAMSVIEPSGEEWKSPWPPEFEYRRQMKHQNQICSTSMYRRSIWQRVGGYRRRCPTAEDADFWCRATSFGANAKRVTDAVVLRYRNRPDSMSNTQEDWGWHQWYPWGKQTDLTPWLAPVDDERTDPIIPMHEFSLVSVIIPVGPGHERYVLDALDSVRSQTFRWWEAIVVNDTGGPLPGLPAWAHVVHTTGAIGAGAARNFGMAAARGETFVFLDADDYFQPEALELMYVEQHRVGGFVYTDWYRHDTGEVHHAPEWDGCDSVLRQLPWPVTCMYPRAVWEKVGGFDEELPAWEDWDFALKVVAADYCGTRLAVPLFHYRMDTGRRREEGFSERETLKEEIFKRWSKYITREERMPCGCSGGGGAPSLPSFDVYAQAMNPSTPSQQDGAVLIEYVGDAAAPISYTGMKTGARYRFGSDPDHKVRWVYKDDVDHFLNREEFRLYASTEASPALAAAGPPR